jgi:hypothetical protein
MARAYVRHISPKCWHQPMKPYGAKTQHNTNIIPATLKNLKSHILISFAKSEQNQNKRNEQIFVQGLYEIFIYLCIMKKRYQCHTLLHKAALEKKHCYYKIIST